MDPIARIFAQEAGICIAGAIACAALGYFICWLRHRHDARRAEDRVYRAIESRRLRDHQA